MAPRPLSWDKDYEEFDFNRNTLSLIDSSGRNSPSERQYMLADMSSSPTRQTYGADTPPIASSSTNVSSSSNTSSVSSTTQPSAGQLVQEPVPDLRRSLVPGPETGPSAQKIPRSISHRSMASSPLNPSFPSSPSSPHILSPFTRPGSRGSAHITRMASEECRALSVVTPFSASPGGTRGSMILYRRVDVQDDVLLPPSLPHAKRQSTTSSSADSFVSLSSDSKYPSRFMTQERGIVAYAYDPTLDDDEVDEVDVLQETDEKVTVIAGHPLSWRGLQNISALGLLIIGMLCLFVLYPVVDAFTDNGRNRLIVGNTRINSSGQAASVDFDPRSQITVFSLYDVIDHVTPQSARSRTGVDGEVYELVFSDEFETEGRTFYAEDDLFWEAADDDLYDPRHVSTEEGFLVIRSNPDVVSGLIRSRTQSCLRGGFVEIGVVSPGREARTLYWSGSWSAVDGASKHVPQVVTSLDQSLSIKLNIGIAVNPSDQSPPTTSSRSPAVLLVDYVRYYQRAGQTSSCSDVIRLQHLDLPSDFLSILLIYPPVNLTI